MGPRSASLQLGGCGLTPTPAPGHVVLGEASRVPVLGSQAAARRGVVSAPAASQAPRQLLGARVCTMGLLSGDAPAPDSHALCTEDTFSAGGAAQTPTRGPGVWADPGSDRQPEGCHVVPTGLMRPSVDPSPGAVGLGEGPLLWPGMASFPCVI